MNGGEIIAEFLKKQGVEFLFTLCGGHISPILVGAKNHGIRVIDVRQEPTAVFAADAVGRLTGIPGVAAVTAGPGVTNSVTAIKNAQMAQAPMILLGGAAATILKGRGALQDIEQIELYQSITKWATTIEQDCDIVPILEEAFDVAVSGIPGPVFVECPIDLLYDEEIVRKWYGEKSGKAKSIMDKIVKWYLRRHVDKLFACSPKSIEISKEADITPFHIDESNVKVFLSQLNNAESPVMVIGNQAMFRVENAIMLQKAIEKLNIPVFLTGMARGLMGEDHPLYYRHGRTNALRNADLVIIVGMPLDFRLNYGRSINRDATFISINRSKEEMKENKKPDIAIQADPSTFLMEAAEEFNIQQKKYADWVEKLKTGEQKGKEKIEIFSAVETEYINPLQLCQKINQLLDEDSIIIGDGGDFIATVAYTVKPKAPLSWLDPGPYGTLGVGAGFALAAKLVRPDSEVWLMYGDGALGYSLIEFDTFVRHNIPVISVVGNDAGWTQITRDQVEYLNDDVATTLRYNNYDTVAKSFGAAAYNLRKYADIENILLEAKQKALSGIPVLINAYLGKTDYRKGSISV